MWFSPFCLPLPLLDVIVLDLKMPRIWDRKSMVMIFTPHEGIYLLVSETVYSPLWLPKFSFLLYKHKGFQKNLMNTNVGACWESSWPQSGSLSFEVVLTQGRIDIGTFHGEHCLVGLCSFSIMLKGKPSLTRRLAPQPKWQSTCSITVFVGQRIPYPAPGMGDWHFSCLIGKESEIPGVRAS